MTFFTSAQSPMSVMGKRSLAKPGSMPVVKQVAPPSAQASVIGSIHEGGFWLHVGPDPRRHRRRADVDAGPQEGAHVGDVGVGLARRRAVVHQRIGSQRGERTEVVGGTEPEGADPADLPHVAADLVLVVHADPDELEVRVADDLGDDHLADEPGTPDDDLLLALSWATASHRNDSPHRSLTCDRALVERLAARVGRPPPPRVVTAIVGDT